MTRFGPLDPEPTREQRLAFSRRVDRSGGPDACWPFVGTPNPDGYMRLRLNGDTAYAHRAAYRMAVGPIPDGMLVCHTCDNPPCCNPAHHFLGTQLDNQRDKVAKGHHVHTLGKLSIAEIEFVRAARGQRAMDLAGALHVSVRTIYRVLDGSTYRDYRFARPDSGVAA